MRGLPLPSATRGLAELPEAARAEALRRWRVLRPHLDDGLPLPRAAGDAGVPLRTAQRWLTHYRADGLAGLARPPRTDRGTRRLPEQLRLLIEGLALRPPGPSAAHVHRIVVDVAKNQGWPVPSYATVYAVIQGIDPAMRTLALDGKKRYREVFDLIHRREAARPNEIWQADHTQLDLWVIAPSGKPARPRLTVIEDDHSRAIAGYAVNLGAPSALQTALALRQAIWRKSEPGWHVCGIPGTCYTDHGSDFTSQHLLHRSRLRLHLPAPGAGRRRPEDPPGVLPAGQAPRPREDRAVLQHDQPDVPAHPARLRPARHHRPRRAGPAQPRRARRGDRPVHRRGVQPAAAQRDRPAAAGPLGRRRVPAPPTRQSEQLDLLLLTIAKPRKVHPDGIHLFGLRYLDTSVLGEYVGEPVTIRYDPRDVAEIRVFYDDRFLCRAICPELATQSIGIKEISAARNARRRGLTHGLTQRASVVDRLLAVHQPPPDPTPAAPEVEPARPAAPALKLYRED